MGSSSSVPSALDDFYYVKKEFANQEYYHKYRIKDGFALIEQLGAFMNQVETLQIKCSQEQRDVHISVEKSKKLKALSIYLDIVLADLRTWRQEEQDNLDRLNKVRDRMESNKKLIEEVENGNVDAVLKFSQSSS
ncbi:uncharacterized protein [Anabrus simplex]|uniref:uncharacterized protein isoform X2 n=1 Tax=Anabrus simplex TaxID=316456 RepID=UPI0035A3BADE